MKTSKRERQELLDYYGIRENQEPQFVHSLLQDFETQTQRVAILEEALERVEKETNRTPLLTDGAIVMVRRALQRSKELGT